jgi:hypothetical protein
VESTSPLILQVCTFQWCPFIGGWELAADGGIAAGGVISAAGNLAANGGVSAGGNIAASGDVSAGGSWARNGDYSAAWGVSARNRERRNDRGNEHPGNWQRGNDQPPGPCWGFRDGGFVVGKWGENHGPFPPGRKPGKGLEGVAGRLLGATRGAHPRPPPRSRGRGEDRHAPLAAKRLADRLDGDILYHALPSSA